MAAAMTPSADLPAQVTAAKQCWTQSDLDLCAATALKFKRSDSTETQSIYLGCCVIAEHLQRANSSRMFDTIFHSNLAVMPGIGIVTV